MHDDDPPSPEDAEFGFMDDFGLDEGADASTRDAHAWRMPALAAGTCLAAIAVAIILLQYSGGSSNKDVSLPIVTGGPTSPALISSPIAPPTTAAVPKPAHPIRRLHTSARPTRTHTSAATTTSATPTRASTTPSSHPPSTTVAPSSTSAAPTPGVRLSKGGRDYRCGTQCYFLVVTLTNFAGGHHVACEAKSHHAQVAVEFGNYDTASPVSFGCSYDRQHDSVFVIVDGTYHSNTVIW